MLTSGPALPVRSCDLAFMSIVECNLLSKVLVFSEQKTRKDKKKEKLDHI